MFVYQAHKTETMVLALVFSLRITVVNRKGVCVFWYVEKWHRHDGGERGEAHDSGMGGFLQSLSFSGSHVCSCWGVTEGSELRSSVGLKCTMESMP